MRIDLNCPLEVWRTELPREGYSACELRLYNLSDQVVVSAEVTLMLMDAEGREVMRLVYRGHELDSQPGKTCRMAVPVPEDAAPAAADVIIEKVWYDSGVVWRRGRHELIEYTSNALPSSRELEALQFVAGPTAVGFPEVQGGVWLCVCGRPNAINEEHCVRCGQARDEVFDKYSREAVAEHVARRTEELDTEARAVREEAARRQASREKDFVSRKKQRSPKAKAAMGALVLALVLGTAAYGVVGHLMPWLRYRGALDALAAGRYTEAMDRFAAMGDYGQAPEKLIEARLAAADEDLNSGEQARIISARATFTDLAAQEGSSEKVQLADYRLAGILLDAGDVTGARAAYAALGEYADSADRVKACDYQLACDLLEKGNLAGAQAAFEALGGYADSADQAKMARNRAIAALLDDGMNDDALALLAELEDDDAAGLTKRAHYQKAQALAAADKPLEAGDEYLLAGDYQDAATQAQSCIYEPAVAAMEKGDWYTAAPLLSKLPGYEDVDERLNVCLFNQAAEAVKDTEYIRAAELLAQLPADYEGAEALRNECVYRPALAALKNGDYQAAVDGFAQLGNYEDSPKQLQKAQYKLAGQLAEEGRLEDAATLYASLGNYQQSASELKKVRYALADQYLKAGEYQKAIDLYTELKSYHQSAEHLKEAQYALADQLMIAGDYEAAKALYAGLGKYEQARTKAKACDYARAEQLEADGQADDAAAIFADLGNYEDAPLRVKAIRYRQADLMADEDPEAAGDAFAALGDYSDAPDRAKSAWLEAADSVAAGNPAHAVALYEKAGSPEDAAELIVELEDAAYADLAVRVAATDDPATVAYLLSQVELTAVPERYAELPKRYVQACYDEGRRLLEAGEPDAAYPYLQRCIGFRNADQLMDRTAWKLLGTWSAGDYSMTMLPDGTCVINDETLAWQLAGYNLLTGADEQSLTVTHKLTNITNDRIVLRDVRDGNVTLALNRTAPAPLLPLPRPEAATATDIPPAE